MNRVTDFVPAVSANSESRKLLRNAIDCSKAPLCIGNHTVPS